MIALEIVDRAPGRATRDDARSYITDWCRISQRSIIREDRENVNVQVLPCLLEIGLQMSRLASIGRAAPAKNPHSQTLKRYQNEILKGIKTHTTDHTNPSSLSQMPESHSGTPSRKLRGIFSCQSC